MYEQPFSSTIKYIKTKITQDLMEYKKAVRVIMSNRNNNLPKKIEQIKHNVNSGKFKEALSINPLIKKILNKQPYFHSLNSIYIKEPFGFSEDLKIEFRWLAASIEAYFEDINIFLGWKNDFEVFVIKDQFKEAKNILKKIEGKFGISLWSIEANFIIEDRVNGTKSNWNKLSYSISQIKNSLYEFIINSSSKRIESKMSFESFLNQFQNDIDTINTNGMMEDFFVFKNFNYPDYDYRYKNLESIFYIANVFSVIDKYLILIDAISYNINETRENDRLYEVFLRNAKKIITNDPRIYNIYNLINQKEDFDNSTENEVFLNCMDEYYRGNFEQSLELSKKGLIENPLEFQYYEIYCKSLINIDKGFEALELSVTSDKILSSVFHLFSFDINEKENFTTLLNISLHLMNTNLGVQIFSLLSEIEGTNDRNYIRGLLASNYCTFKFLYFSKYRSSNLKNLNALSNSHCFKVNRFKLGFDVDFEGLISNSKEQQKSYSAIRKFKKGDYKSVIEDLKNDKLLNRINYYYDRKVSLLFNSYLNLDLFKEALLLFGEIFFNKTFKTRKVQDYKLYNYLSDIDTKEDLYDLIEFPILVSMHVKEYDLYEVYDEFLVSQEIDELSSMDINRLIEKFNFERTIYFLENVVTIDTIKYSTEYGSISEVEEDRVSILNELIRHNPDNKLKYEKEINEIYRINSVRKVLKEVDAGRLYIDVDNLKKNQVKKFQDDFKRFKEIEQSTSVQALFGFNASNHQNWEGLLSGSRYVIDSYNSADYLAFKNIYLESRENLLFSKEYGLDSSLSTRIRHGALKNHIRSVFEKFELVTSKLNDVYRDNEVWKEQLKGHFYLNIRTQKILKSFSKDIDEYSSFIVEKLIQIQTEKTRDKEYGIFKFFTNDNILYEYYLLNRGDFDSIERIIDTLLTNLVNHMLVDVQIAVRKQFTQEIWRNFQRIIDGTISELRKLDLPNDCQLIPNLTKSNTEIQNELEVISEWFYLNTTNSTKPLSIIHVINASVELTNKIKPNYQISPTVNLNCRDFNVYSSLIFVFNILFNNVIEHSKLPSEENKISLDIDLVENKFICMAFCNNLKPNTDYKMNINRLNKVKENWNDHKNIDRSNKEGESGFDKIKRILLYETYSKTDRFDFSFANNTIEIKLYFPLPS
ncbi:hypothetical protein ACFO3O_20825 [Dokdonia ponticola]|uniref:ATP-binding protein n=1 Tax=Dokdonia ponticola TaxID=2041041 RepID=A0ABV9I3F7_9FLAO